MHTTRVITALLVGLAALAVILFGGEVGFSVLVMVASAICLFEYLKMSLDAGNGPILIFCLAGLLAPGFAAAGLGLEGVCGAMLSWLLLVSVYFLVTYGRRHDPFGEMTKVAFGLFYVGFCSSHILFIRLGQQGEHWVLFLLLVVFAGDTGAYYTGRFWGRHKLHPAVSSGKTREGAVGGALGSLAMALVLDRLFFHQINLSLLCGAILGPAGQVGDLVASMAKRHWGVKDSSHILPGHGGMLDRVDGVLLAAPVLYWTLTLFGYRG